MVFNTRVVAQKECNAFVGLGEKKKEGGEGSVVLCVDVDESGV